MINMQEVQAIVTIVQQIEIAADDPQTQAAFGELVQMIEGMGKGITALLHQARQVQADANAGRTNPKVAVPEPISEPAPEIVAPKEGEQE